MLGGALLLLLLAAPASAVLPSLLPPPPRPPQARLTVHLPAVSFLQDGTYALAPVPGYGLLQFCAACDLEPPTLAPWALLVCLDSPILHEALFSALEYNATAIIVIVDNEDTDTPLVTRHIMRFSFKESYIQRFLQIPIVAVKKITGERLLALTDSDGRIPVSIIPAENFKGQDAFLSAVVITIVFLLFCVLSCQFVERTRRPVIQPICSPYESAVSKIPTQKLTENKDTVFDEENKCAVCIESFQANELVSHLPCSHVFHKECIEPWLLSKRLCPMCKMDVIKFYGPVNIGSEESIVDIPLDEQIYSVHDEEFPDSEEPFPNNEDPITDLQESFEDNGEPLSGNEEN